MTAFDEIRARHEARDVTSLQSDRAALIAMVEQGQQKISELEAKVWRMESPSIRATGGGKTSPPSDGGG